MHPTSDETMPHPSIRALELIGVPGIGKTTIADALAEQLGPSNVRPREGQRHRRSTLAALLSIATTPALAWPVLRVVRRVARGVDAPRRPRLRRAWKIFKGLARIATNRRRLLLMDEGPIVWLLTAQWGTAAARDQAVTALLEFYQQACCAVVLIDGPPELAASRIRARPQLSARRGAPGLVRTDIPDRARLLSSLTPELERHVTFLRQPVEATDRPSVVASTIIARLGLTVVG